MSAPQGATQPPASLANASVQPDLGAYERGLCGDANADGKVDVVDVFYLINALFAGGPRPIGLANVNGDATLDVLDVFYLINRLFASGAVPNCAGA